MNEVVNKHTFDLYMKARKKKVEVTWAGAIWLREGKIFARSDIDNRIFGIVTKADLSCIK